MLVNLVYNSPGYSIVEYPKQGAYEIVNKSDRLIGFIMGNVALRFRRELEEAFDSQDNLENSEEFLEDLMSAFSVFMTFPAVIH